MTEIVGNLEPVNYKSKEKGFMLYKNSNSDSTLYAGFECLKGIYSFMLGCCTDFTGFPGSGKSEFALEILFHLSEAYGHRHALYVPDIGNYNEIRRKLLQKYTRKFLNHLTEQEIFKANTWIDFHFLILQKKDAKKPVSPKMFWDYVAEYKDESGVVHTGLIDSWKNLRHEYSGREDQYLDDALSYRNELAEQANKHYFTIAHSGKTEYVPEEKRRRIPSAYDMKGGGSWFDNGKVMCTVDYADKESHITDVYFSKVKPDVLGKVGEVKNKLYFDWQKSRYYEIIDGYQPRFYAGDAKKNMPRLEPILSLVEPKQAEREDEEFAPAPF